MPRTVIPGTETGLLNGEVPENKERNITIGVAFATLLFLSALTSIAIAETRRKPAGLSKVTPAPNTTAPSTSAPSRALTDSVDFTTDVKGPDQEGRPYSQSCTEILAANASGVTNANPTLQGIAWAGMFGLLGGSNGPCTSKQICAPDAAIPCDVAPSIGISPGSRGDCAAGSSSSNTTESGSTAASSSSSNQCIDVGRLSCLMDPVRKIFQKVVKGCEQVQKGNKTAVCGQNDGSTLFNSSMVEPDNSTLITTKGFFTCHGKGKARGRDMAASNYPKGMPLRAHHHR